MAIRECVLAGTVLAASMVPLAGQGTPSPEIGRDAAGNVVLGGPAGCELRYWLIGPGASSLSHRYDGPFDPGQGLAVGAVAIPPDPVDYAARVSPLARDDFGVAGIEPQAEDVAKWAAPWEAYAPDLTAGGVQRTRDDLPLPDQANEGKWLPYAPLTDEFEGDALDAAKWWPNNPSWKGRQPAFFYPGNVTVSDGELHLAMRKQEVPEAPKDEGYHTYTSAAVQSKQTVRYGYFEVKARPMKSAGSSSFWFYDTSDGWWTEIDVYEIGGRAPGYERKLNMTVHVMKTPAEKQHISIGSFYETPWDLVDDYHVYGLEWDEQELRFYLDGVLVRWGPNTHWHQPLTLNFDSETMPDWFGLPKDEDLPSTYSIEYVRAWKRGE